MKKAGPARHQPVRLLCRSERGPNRRRKARRRPADSRDERQSRRASGLVPGERDQALSASEIPPERRVAKITVRCAAPMNDLRRQLGAEPKHASLETSGNHSGSLVGAEGQQSGAERRRLLRSSSRSPPGPHTPARPACAQPARGPRRPDPRRWSRPRCRRDRPRTSSSADGGNGRRRRADPPAC